ncbi:MAG: hypothetical protein LBH47_01385 [Christensenellaceae bacterium]|jgi:hypothetical protein|nr:hypothetical protein [Christensenellaceae bacterium]
MDEINKNNLEQMEVSVADNSGKADADTCVNDTVSTGREHLPEPDNYTEISKLKKSYKDLYASFTKKSQQVKELERIILQMPTRDKIINDYLLEMNSKAKVDILASSSSAFDYAEQKKPTSIKEACKLARDFLANN